ncbi:D-alanyl-D-alanine endopeptidase [Methylophilus aquaticus]|uniref:D-alanyl-D-alanine endopeptidase n=1 Tax=Methylophilus aquaticus TaxID=1971610 RepID=A0ABT9JPM4_9PROT|nr:D-alanyl-D-alanine endopeptidase [Methylophilus aquaticus]MDP8566520.1 D-alanyl-D-alanine endopeptidase [Methylophilus aquaticus]
MGFFTRCFKLLLVSSLAFAPVEHAAAKSPVKKQHVSASKQKKYITRVPSQYRVNQEKTKAMRPTKLHAHARKSAKPAIAADMYDAYEGKSSVTNLAIASTKALVINQNTHEIIYSKNLDTPTPIASVTKLMTAMVVLDAKLDLREQVSITEMDVDYLKGTSSRLPVGTTMTREDLLNLALIASENRAASALATHYPGGKQRFIQDMNSKAASLGMMNTRFEDSTGLTSNNISTASDLAKMVHAAYQYPLIRQITTTADYDLQIARRQQPMHFHNTNALVRAEQSNWEIGLSKTGYISEAGRCLVMQATIAGEPFIMVLLDSVGKLTRIGDARRIKKWMEHNYNTLSSLDQHGEIVLTGLSMSKSLNENAN